MVTKPTTGILQVSETAQFRKTMVEMNEALLIGSVRQHELTDEAVRLNAVLRVEIATRQKTARELAEKARLIDLSNDAIIVRDAAGKILLWNRGAEELYGWSREEALGKISNALLQTESSTPLEQITAELHRNDRWTGELTHTKRDGQRITVLVRKALDRDSEGNPAAVLQTITDITERRRSENALRVSELGYRRLFEAAKDGILILEADTGRISDVNPFLAKLLGFTHSEMVGKTVGEFSPFKDIEPNKLVLEQLQKEGYVRYEDLPLETKDGRRVAVEFVSNVYQVGDKKVIQCNIRDISERKAAEIALMRLGAIIESSHDAVYGKDLNGIITNWNKGAQSIFGYTADEIIGTSVKRLIPGELQEDEHQVLEKIKRGESVEHIETLRRTKDGQLINVSVTASPIKDATGKVIGVSKVARDITERKRAEQELLAAKNAISRHAVELEETVAERTAKLRETIGELEAFSYSVSHDMRAPLRAMRGFSKILLERHSAQLDAEGLKYLEKIDAAAGRMDTLIQDVLTYTRVLRAEVKIKPVDLDVLVRQVIGIYPQLQTDNAEIQIEGVLPKVLGGEASLAQCLSNLLTNAVKFVAPGTKPRVKVWAEAIAGEEVAGQEVPGAKGQVSGKEPDTSHLTPRTFPHIRLWVEDNGIGIAPKDQVRIFKMFERVGRASSYEGTGMGLAIVRKAVERMGGQMGVESEVGQGSKFWIQLKAANL